MHHYKKRISLIAICFFTLIALFGCAKKEPAREVSLSVLEDSPAEFNNSQVTTNGKVRHFETPMHYWIEDESLNRVEVVPHDKVGPYLGQFVVVTGEFRFSATTGRSIILSEIKRH